MISASPTGPATLSIDAWPGDADRGQRVVDAPDRAEQADERRGRADGGEEREAVLQAALHVVDRALDRHRDPVVAGRRCSSERPRGARVASMPVSAMKRNGLPFFSASAPFAHRRRAPERLLRASRACVLILDCSYTLVMMMYQLPIDITTRMTSVTRATKSPPLQSASRPYGLSTTSVARIDGGKPAGAGAAAAAAGSAGAAAAGAAGCACAWAGCGRAVRVAASEQDRGQGGQSGHLQHGVSRQ